MGLVLLHAVAINFSSYHSCSLHLLGYNCKNMIHRYFPVHSEIQGHVQAQFIWFLLFLVCLLTTSSYVYILQTSLPVSLH